MLSKNTQNLFSMLLRASHNIKPRYFAPLVHSVSPSPLTTGLPQLHNSLHSFSKYPFSNSAKDDSDSNNTKPTSETNEDEKINPEKAKLKVSATTAKKEKSTTSAPATAEKVEEKKLQTAPIRPVKLPLREGEEELKVETYVLFNSNTPIIPYSHQNGLIKTGNLGTSHISNKLAFFLQNAVGEIYTVGIILEDNVNKTLKKTFTQGTISPAAGAGPVTGGRNTGFSLEEKNKYRAEISVKPKNYKIRLIEIEFRDNCIFAKGVPYPDSKPTAAEKRVNVPQVLGEIKETVAFIKNAFSLEKIDVFRDFTLEIPEGKKVDPQHLDKILCTILAECFKLSSYTKENLHTFVQTFLEERSITQRLFLIKKKLEEVKNIMDIVSQSVKYSDDQVWKSHDSAKARLSYEYIRSNYFGGDPSAGTGAARGAAANQNANPNLTGPAKKFMEKLPLIKDEASREKVRKEIERFALQDKMSGEYHKLYTYLDDVFSIPWDKLSEEYWDIEYSHKVLEKQLFGLEKVKERIIEMIAVNKLKRVGGNSGTQSNLPEKRKGFVILLNGPPGTGKTTIAKAIATALKRESRFISFAGVTDPAFVKGHKRTYLDAQPGVFVKELIKARVMNPVFILDEVDKLGKHHQGVDPYYALMEILNPEENQNFGDHYLDIKVDFSNVIFILTSNHSLNMLEPLRNRLEIIEVPPYIEQEKLLIAKNYLLPSVLVENGLNNQSVRFDDETLRRIIKGWCYYESGVRELRRCIEKISRKHALEILDNYSPEPSTQQPLEPAANKEEVIETTSTTTASIPALPHPQQVVESQKIDFSTKPSSKPEVVPVQEAPVEKSTTKIDPEEEAVNRQEVTQLIQLREQHKLIFDADKDPSDESLKKYLGLPVFDDMYERKNKTLHTGTANVLTVSGFVGHVLSVECVYDVTNPVGKGLFNCSGNLQKVLQESLTIARLNALTFLPADKIKEISEKNIHIHFLSGSSPKDGPSAGISICSALISLALNKPIDSGISMTGELSLNGEVYKIGGVQAKVTASKALDIKRIILPYGNRADFFELPQMLKEGLEVYFVKEYREVYKILFGDSPKDLEGIEKVTNGKIVPAMQRAEDIMAYTRT